MVKVTKLFTPIEKSFFRGGIPTTTLYPYLDTYIHIYRRLCICVYMCAEIDAENTSYISTVDENLTPPLTATLRHPIHFTIMPPFNPPPPSHPPLSPPHPPLSPPPLTNPHHHPQTSTPAPSSVSPPSISPQHPGLLRHKYPPSAGTTPSSSPSTPSSSSATPSPPSAPPSPTRYPPGPPTSPSLSLSSPLTQPPRRAPS